MCVHECMSVCVLPACVHLCLYVFGHQLDIHSDSIMHRFSSDHVNLSPLTKDNFIAVLGAAILILIFNYVKYM